MLKYFSGFLLLALAMVLASCRLNIEWDNAQFQWDVATVAIVDQPVDDPDYTQTLHPIVLVHGLNGFDSVLGLNYFHNVPKALEAGGAKVFAPSMSTLNTNEVRGEQLIAFLDDQIAIDPGINKFNLIAHSHGAQTARYVAAVRPDLIASVSSVGGVNKLGSEKAEIITDAYQSLAGTVLVDVSFTMLAWIFDNLSAGGGGLPQYPRGAFESVDYAGTEAFNVEYPIAIPTAECDSSSAFDTDVSNGLASDGIYYYSWGGIGVKTNRLDPLDKILEATIEYFPDDQNDGTLGRCATHLGMVIKDDYAPMNHTDLTYQAIGLIHPDAPYPLTLYRIHANRLKLQGL